MTNILKLSAMATAKEYIKHKFSFSIPSSQQLDNVRHLCKRKNVTLEWAKASAYYL